MVVQTLPIEWKLLTYHTVGRISYLPVCNTLTSDRTVFPAAWVIQGRAQGLVFIKVPSERFLEVYAFFQSICQKSYKLLSSELALSSLSDRGGEKEAIRSEPK